MGATLLGRVAAELAPPCKGFFSRNSRKILYETRTDGAQEEQRGELQELRAAISAGLGAEYERARLEKLGLWQVQMLKL